jgi:predicted ATP-binding protein involved in virulence
MVENNIPAPANFKGVMVSSTFTDLKEHRDELMKALRKEEIFAIGMEDYVPTPKDDVISSSINMVGKGSAYIGLISHRCGQVPESAERNPQGYSITRLEFEEAQRLGLPTLIFVMGDDHSVKPSDVETDAEKHEKLEAYRERAKEGRIYVVFESLEDFTREVIHAVAKLRCFIYDQAKSAAAQPQDPIPTPPPSDSIPTPPAFYAEPPYIGSHEFVGRKAQLDILDDWASPADSHPVLLFEAIDGVGKSMLTWEWVTKHATSIREDWAGCFWYSFYERGAIMADFCRRALAYITGRPLKEFRKKKTAELGELLLHQLQERPWLIVFDGLERVLVAYHRFDAAQITDEEADAAVDQIAHRDPCAAIRPEDDEILHALAGAAPSKLLLTSRLIPRILLNASSQPIPGVLRERLPGLRPPEAEALFRSCGITGDSEDMQNYLQSHCDCHPLVIGVLAGLVNDYLPDRGNFDAWVADPDGGGKFNLADLDLVQKRNHILKAALAALDDKSRQLLSTLALLFEAVDYLTLNALNPHLPGEPEKVEKPKKPEKGGRWKRMTDEKKEQARKSYQADLKHWEEYEQAMRARQESPEFLSAPQKLQETVRDLESRGLLQYDAQTKRYDLHPIVRGIAAGGLRQDEKDRHRQDVIDMYIARIEISNIRCFDKIEVTFLSEEALPPHLITTLLGENGTGKSTLLRCIALGLCTESDAVALMKRLPGNMIRDGRDGGTITIELISMKDSQRYSLTTSIHKYAGTDEEILRQSTNSNFAREDIFICGYGPHRSVTADSSFVNYSRIESVLTLFDDSAVLQNPDLTLLRQPRSVRNRLKATLYETLMLGQFNPHDETEKEQTLVHGPWGQFPIEVLSHGYKSMAQWILDLLAWSIADNRLLNSRDLTGIVLIDEVEQHLHPEWQRHVLRLLSKQFPKIQFIVTTHSPLVVSGQPATQVCRFLDDGKGNITKAELANDTTLGRADQVLTGQGFGLRSTLDEITYGLVAEYQQLIQLEDNTPEQIQKLNELRSTITSRIPPPGETLAERRAQQLIDLLLFEWVGQVDDEARLEIRNRAYQLLDAVAGERRAQP